MDSSTITAIKQARIKPSTPHHQPLVEFIEHPQDSLVTGKLPVLVQCTVRNAGLTFIECNQKPRDDVKRNISWKDNLKYETLSLFVKKKDFEVANVNNNVNTKQQMRHSNNPNRITCKCVAYSNDNIEKFFSHKALIRNSYLENEFQTEPMDEISYEEETIEMRCDPPRGEPTPSVYWLKDDKEIVDTVSDSSRFKLSNDYSLLILSARIEDSGNYICVAHNQIETKRKSKPAKLTILESSKRYQWSEWSEWSPCSAKCQQKNRLGSIKRLRSCQTTNKLAQTQNVSIDMCLSMAGEDKTFEEELPCRIDEDKCRETTSTNMENESNEFAEDIIEPILGEWSEWSSWSSCNTNECKQYRKRTCLNIYSSNNKVITENKKPICPKGDKQQSKHCDMNKLCKGLDVANHRHHNDHKNDEYALFTKPLNASTSNKALTKQENASTNLLFTYSLAFSSLLGLLFLLLALFFLIRKKFLPNQKRKSKKNSQLNELNLYYTCERQQKKKVRTFDDDDDDNGSDDHEEKCSMFQYARHGTATLNVNNTSSSSASSSTSTSTTTNIFKTLISTPPTTTHPQTNLYSNVLDLNQNPQLLLVNSINNSNNYTQQQNQFEIHQIQLISQSQQNQLLLNEMKPNSAFKPVSKSITNNKNKLNQTSASASSKSSSTKSIELSASSSASPNTSSQTNTNLFYTNPLMMQMNNSKNDLTSSTFKLISINNMPTLIKTNNHHLNGNENNFTFISSPKNNAYKLVNQDDQKEELAYEISDAFNLNVSTKKPPSLPLPPIPVPVVQASTKSELKFDYIDRDDLCIASACSSGVKLSLGAGEVNFFVPESCVSSNISLYLGVIRNETFKPKQSNFALLSEVIAVGSSPANINTDVSKPFLIIIDHCAYNLNQDWNVKLFYAPIPTDDGAEKQTPQWNEMDLSSNENISLMHNEDKELGRSRFVLMTNKLGLYVVCGCMKENKTSSQPPSASRYYRLVSFASESITTTKEFNMRIYCIDNLLLALQEVLRDEKNYNGSMMEISEPFLISNQNTNGHFLSIQIDELDEKNFKCKFNVTRQEIPLNHILNGRNHLLHCSFTFEKLMHSENLTKTFHCKIKASLSNGKKNKYFKDIHTQMTIDSELENVLRNSKLSLKQLEWCLGKWFPNNDDINHIKPDELLNPKHFSNSYFKVNQNFKSQICSMLDADEVNTQNNSFSWKDLADKLGIENKYYKYFKMNKSPTSILLFYFEAISDMKVTSVKSSNLESNSDYYCCKEIKENYHELFLNCFMEVIKANENLIKIIYNENLFS